MSRRPSDYSPIDEVLDQAPVRILRALRFCGWIDIYDFRDMVLNCTNEDRRSKDAIATALRRLAKSGMIEKRPGHGICWTSRSESHCYDLRITRVGVAYLEKKLRADTVEVYAPARPGSEHLLIAEDACA